MTNLPTMLGSPDDRNGKRWDWPQTRTGSLPVVLTCSEQNQCSSYLYFMILAHLLILIDRKWGAFLCVFWIFFVFRVNLMWSIDIKTNSNIDSILIYKKFIISLGAVATSKVVGIMIVWFYFRYDSIVCFFFAILVIFHRKYLQVKCLQVVRRTAIDLLFSDYLPEDCLVFIEVSLFSQVPCVNIFVCDRLLFTALLILYCINNLW